MNYLSGNLDLMENILKEKLPHISMIRPEATCLAWMDFSNTGLTNEQQQEKLVKQARVGLSNGTMFGVGGEGFQRFNFASPRSLVEEGIERIVKAFV